jgi:excisionase family DNA binding protein
MSKELLTITEFCEASNLGRTRVYELLQSGELKAVKIGRRTFIRREDMQAWLAGLSTYPVRNAKAAEASHVGL